MGFQAKDGALRKLNGLGGRFQGSLQQAAEAVGQLLVETSRKGQAHGPKTGLIYGGHQASAPGEYSAPRTHALYNSTAYEVTGSGFVFGVGTEYGGYQEFGTTNMKPRPNLQQSYETNEAQLRDVFGAQLLMIF